MSWFDGFLERSWAFQTGLVLGVTLGCVLLHAIATFARAAPRPPRARLSFLARATLLGTGLVLLPLAATAFYGMFAHGHVRGLNLLVHVGLGGAFTVLLALIALVIGAHGLSRLDRDARPLSALAVASFWLAVLAGFVTAGSMIASTFPWLGTEELRAALELHRYAGLALIAAVLVFAYALLLQRLRRV